MKQVLHPTSHWGSDNTSATDSPFRSLSVLMKVNMDQSRKFPTVALFGVAMLGLSGCDKYPASSNFSSNEHDEITDIADGSAETAISDSEKIKELEGRIEDLEAQQEAQ